MGLLAAFATLVGPFTARVLLALGMSVVSITGMAVAIGALKTQALNALGGLPGAALQLVGLAGGWLALGMIFGAATFCLTLWATTSALRIGSAAA